MKFKRGDKAKLTEDYRSISGDIWYMKDGEITVAATYKVAEEQWVIAKEETSCRINADILEKV